MDATIEIPVQVNGKLRGKVIVSADSSQKEVLAAARAAETVKTWLEGKTVVKELYVEKKLVSFVVK